MIDDPLSRGILILSNARAHLSDLLESAPHFDDEYFDIGDSMDEITIAMFAIARERWQRHKDIRGIK